MGLKGKLMASIEMKCGVHLIHDIFHTNAHHIPTISRAFNRFEIHEGEIIKFGSIISWNYNDGNTHFSTLSFSYSHNMIYFHHFSIFICS